MRRHFTEAHAAEPTKQLVRLGVGIVAREGVANPKDPTVGDEQIENPIVVEILESHAETGHVTTR